MQDLQNLQIKLLYEQYNWTPDQIGSLLSLSPSIIRLTIEEQAYKQNQLVVSQEQTQQSIERLKADEVNKQQHIVPIMAAIEISLFAKIMEMTKACESPSEVAHVVKAYKSLTQDAVVNAVIREEKTAGGKQPTIAVQIINEVA